MTSVPDIICRLVDNFRHTQKKATNFYTSANVKNKSRKKATLMKTLQKGAVNERKRRR